MHNTWLIPLKCVLMGLVVQAIAAIGFILYEEDELAGQQWSATLARTDELIRELRMEIQSSALLEDDTAHIQALLRRYAPEAILSSISYVRILQPASSEQLSGVPSSKAVESDDRLNHDVWLAGGENHLSVPVVWRTRPLGEIQLGISGAYYAAIRHANRDRGFAFALTIMGLSSSLLLGVSLLWVRKWDAFLRAINPSKRKRFGFSGSLDWLHQVFIELKDQLQHSRNAERRQALAAHALFQGIHQVAIITLNRQAQVVDWSRGAQNLLGFEGHEIQGHHIDNLFFGEARAGGVFCELAERIATHRPVIEECSWVHRCGDVVPVKVEIARRVDENGEECGYFIVVISLASHVQSMQSWRRRCQELNEKIRERTIELDFVKRHAETLQRSHQAFVTRLSQELRIPANTILGYTQLLEEDKHIPLPAYQRRNVHEIMTAGGQLLNCISQLIEFAKPQNGGNGFVLESVAFMPLVQECIQKVQNLVSYREVQIVLNCTSDILPAVLAERERLVHILTNILLTMSEHANVGDTLELEMAVGARHVRLVLNIAIPQNIDLIWANEGVIPGMADVNAYFYGGYNFGGVKTLLEIIGGGLAVEIIPNQGLRATMELMRDVEKSSPELKIEEAPMTGNQQRNATKGERVVLYIEDNAANLRLVENILKRHADVRMLGASAPWEGLAMAREHRPDLILVDINLPDIDGYEVLRQLQSQPSENTPHVVAVSASATESDISRGLEAGFERYITKPINVIQFVDTVNSLLEGQGTCPPSLTSRKKAQR
ncbi:MAG: response regulator [Gammaproteobacteria bacterium]|nr:response regulator [Gammaproteobacteria bacterium]